MSGLPGTDIRQAANTGKPDLTKLQFEIACLKQDKGASRPTIAVEKWYC